MRIIWFIVALLAALSTFVAPGIEDDTYMPLVRGGITSTSTSTQTPTATSTATATATATETDVVPGPCRCNADVRNCSDFNTQPEAQACMQFCISQGQGDIHNLDGDANGKACESLPPNFRVTR